MTRREFFALFGGAAFAGPLAAHAQQSDRVRRIGMLLGSDASDPEERSRVVAFGEALQARGWREADNIVVEKRWFGGSSDRAAQYAKEIVALNPDVIVANGTVGIEAVRSVTRTVPTVFVLVGNPVGGGYVGSLARPGGNITGFSAFEPEIAGKWIQLLKEIVPATQHVTLLSYPGYEFLWSGAGTAAAALGIAVTQTTCHDAAEIERAIPMIATSPHGAIVVLPSPLFGLNRELIFRQAAAHALPAVYPFRYYAAAGGLMSYGIDTVDIYRRASLYVDRILKGDAPGDLPVQAPTKFQLIINLKTAKAQGISVPSTLLARADEAIE